MATIKIKELQAKLGLINQIDLSVNDRLTYAVKKNMARFTAILKGKNEALQDRVADVNIEFAQTGERGVLLTDEKGNYLFTPEGQKKRNAKLRDLYREYEEQDIEIEPYYAENSIRMTELDLFMIEELQGIIFKPEVIEA